MNGIETFILFFLIAYGLNILLTSAVHFVAYYWATYCRADIVYTRFFMLPSSIKEFGKYLISVDYWSAKSFKTNALLLNEKNYLGRFIKNSNTINFGIGMLVFIAVIIVTTSFNQGSLNNLSQLIQLIWAIRVISRSAEIIIAFVKDAIDNQTKSSNLASGDRIKLAITSYIEVIANYSVLYYIFQVCFTKFCIQSICCKAIYCRVNSLEECFFNSLGVSTFTMVSFNTCNQLYGKAFIAVHLITAIALVYFALAKYISDKK